MICGSSFGFRRERCLVTITVLLALGSGGRAQVSPEAPDIPAKYEASTSSYDYVKREVMVPMRDGVKLHTVIVISRGASHAQARRGILQRRRDSTNCHGGARWRSIPLMIPSGGNRRSTKRWPR